MKKIFLILSLAFLVSCSNGKAIPIKMVANTSIETDTVIIKDTVQFYHKQKQLDDSVKHLIDSLRTKLFLANYKVEQAKFYVGLCSKTIKKGKDKGKRNKSQDVFLLGWLRRILF